MARFLSMRALPLSQRLLWAAGSLSAGAVICTTLSSGTVAACEEAAEVAGALPGTLFMWGKRFTGNDVIGYCDKTPVEPGMQQVAHMAFGDSVGAACDRRGDVYW